MIGPVILLSKTSFFAMNRTLRPQVLLVGGQSGEGEVEVAGVVDGDDRTAGAGQVLHAGHGELQPLHPPHQAGELDDCPVYRFHIRQPNGIRAVVELRRRWEAELFDAYRVGPDAARVDHYRRLWATADISSH